MDPGAALEEYRLQLAAGLGIAILLIIAVGMGGQQDSPSQGTEQGLASALGSAGWQSQGLSSFTTADVVDGTVSGIDRLRLRATDGERVARLTLLTGIGNTTATSYLDQRRQEIIGRFQDTPTPYSSVPDRDVNCSSAVYPEFEQHPAGTVVTGMQASSTDSYPVCQESAGAYRVRVFLLNCPAESTAIELAIYRPLDAEPDDISIACPA